VADRLHEHEQTLSTSSKDRDVEVGDELAHRRLGEVPQQRAVQRVAGDEARDDRRAVEERYRHSSRSRSTTSRALSSPWTRPGASRTDAGCPGRRREPGRYWIES